MDANERVSCLCRRRCTWAEEERRIYISLTNSGAPGSAGGCPRRQGEATHLQICNQHCLSLMMMAAGREVVILGLHTAWRLCLQSLL